MGKISALFFISLMAMNCIACSKNESSQDISENSTIISDMDNIYISESKGAELMNTNEYTETPLLNITVNGEKFSAVLYDNETTSTLLKNLPLTMNMHELNGNEKYYNLPFSLPTAAESVGQINAGDIMLYGNNCIVIFYESFSTSYSYTKLGYIIDAESFAKSVGNSNVTVDISKIDNSNNTDTQELKSLNDYILNNTTLSQNYDINKNNEINCFDIVMMKNKLIYQKFMI